MELHTCACLTSDYQITPFMRIPQSMSILFFVVVIVAVGKGRSFKPDSRGIIHLI